MTAPEIIYNRADSKKENMGLTTWKNAPDGKILETDVTVAKNYLSQEEITELNNLVSMYLDYAERQVKLGRIISMQEWKDKLEVFLKINEYNILNAASAKRYILASCVEYVPDCRAAVC